jgi:putative addiction module killer protein
MRDNWVGIQVVQTTEFAEWLDRLQDPIARARVVARIRQAGLGHLGDWRSIDGAIAEMRVHFGPGYRVYFVRRGAQLIVLLAGGTKDSQSRDIRRARAMLARIGGMT